MAELRPDRDAGAERWGDLHTALADQKLVGTDEGVGFPPGPDHVSGSRFDGHVSGTGRWDDVGSSSAPAGEGLDGGEAEEALADAQLGPDPAGEHGDTFDAL